MAIGALKESDVPIFSPNVARGTLINSMAANPSALKKLMGVLSNQFAGDEQQDAHEFLVVLIDALHEELEAVTTNSPIKETLHFKIRVCRECNSCGYSRSRDELYHHLSIAMEGEDVNGESWGVERSLEHFFQKEVIEVNCEMCEAGTCATETKEIISRYVFSLFMHVVYVLTHPTSSTQRFSCCIITQAENNSPTFQKVYCHPKR